MEKSKEFLRRIDLIAYWTGMAVAWLIVPMILFLVYEVLARYLFNRPTVWSYDLTYMLYGVHYMLGAAFTLSMKGHTRIDIFYARFSPRGRAIIDLICYTCLFFPVVFFLFFSGIDLAAYSWKIRETSRMSAWRVPLYPFKTIIPIAFALLALQGISEYIKIIYGLKWRNL
jgi:TRAP-type mannitol/chloroaromatic compound transport system permease small subunit